MKQVIVVNASLHMPPGKLAAQVAHASVAAMLTADPKDVQAWLDDGMTKIVLQIQNQIELRALYEKIRETDIAAQLIHDAGRTVLAPGTMTCLGIGPAVEAEIDVFTGGLKLLR